MPFHCPECGGVFANSEDCWSAFGELLALEFVDSAYGRVHHLTVATYMLQHPTRLSRRGWIEMRGLLRLNLQDNVSVAGLRQHIRDAGVTATKGWKLKPDGTCLDGAIGLAWPMTVADIDRRDPVVYGEQVTAWAKSALQTAQRVDAS